MTPRLGLGAGGGVDLTYRERRERASSIDGRFVERGVGLNGSLLSFVLAVYF